MTHSTSLWVPPAKGHPDRSHRALSLRCNTASGWSRMHGRHAGRRRHEEQPLSRPTAHVGNTPPRGLPGIPVFHHRDSGGSQTSADLSRRDGFPGVQLSVMALMRIAQCVGRQPTLESWRHTQQLRSCGVSLAGISRTPPPSRSRRSRGWGRCRCRPQKATRTGAAR